MSFRASGLQGISLAVTGEVLYYRASIMRLQRNPPYWFLVSGSLAWLGLVFLAPWAAARGWPLAVFLYAFFDPVCHQIPERSFACFGYPLGACHRCTGLYLGFTVGLLALPHLHPLRALLLEKPRVMLLFFAPMAIDWALLSLNTPIDRLVTGCVAAFPVGLFVWAAAEQLYQQHRPAGSLATTTEGRT